MPNSKYVEAEIRLRLMEERLAVLEDTVTALAKSMGNIHAMAIAVLGVDEGSKDHADT